MTARKSAVLLLASQQRDRNSMVDPFTVNGKKKEILKTADKSK